MSEALVFHDHSPLEKRRLRRVVREFRENGYQVIEFPSADDLPGFMHSAPPDAIASSDDDNTAIAVRNTYALCRDANLIELTQRISKHPDWRLELLVTNPKSISQGPDLIGTDCLNRREIYVRLAESRDLINAGYYEAALFLIWSAIVATLADVQEREQIVLKKQDGAYVLKQLVSLAVISNQEHHLLWQAYGIQNAISHGLKCEALDEDLLRRLSDTTLRILKS